MRRFCEADGRASVQRHSFNPVVTNRRRIRLRQASRTFRLLMVNDLRNNACYSFFTHSTYTRNIEAIKPTVLATIQPQVQTGGTA